jgi:hypothetical protein
LDCLFTALEEGEHGGSSLVKFFIKLAEQIGNGLKSGSQLSAGVSDLIGGIQAET